MTNKNFFEIENVDFYVGGKAKVKDVSFKIENEGDIMPFLVSNEFNSSQIISDTTFFVSTSTIAVSQQVGIPNFNGQGTNFTSNVFTDFTVHKPLYLSTLDVKCFGGFNRTIQKFVKTASFDVIYEKA